MCDIIWTKGSKRKFDGFQKCTFTKVGDHVMCRNFIMRGGRRSVPSVRQSQSNITHIK